MYDDGVVDRFVLRCRRRAGAATASVVVDVGQDSVIALVGEEGCGIDVRVADGSLGRAGMRGRAQQAGGTVRVEPSPGPGTTIRAEVPVV